MTGRTTIVDAEVGGVLVDVVVDQGVVSAVRPGVRGRRTHGGAVVDAQGGALLPGLHDHHVHLLAHGAALTSVDVGAGSTPDLTALATRLEAADRSLSPGDWLRAVGYHERAAGWLDRVALDRIVPERPARVQHRSGHAWMVRL